MTEQTSGSISNEVSLGQTNVNMQSDVSIDVGVADESSKKEHLQSNIKMLRYWIFITAFPVGSLFYLFKPLHCYIHVFLTFGSGDRQGILKTNLAEHNRLRYGILN